MTTVSDAAQPQAVQASSSGAEGAILLTGRFERPNAGGWLLAGLSLLLFAVSIKFLIVDRDAQVASYPALGGLGFAVFFILFFLRSGSFTLTERALSGRRKVGGAFRVPIEDIAGIDYDADTAYEALAPGIKRPPDVVTVRRRSGKPLQLARMSPQPSPGALWLLVHHRGLIPVSARLLDGTPSALPSGVRQAERQLVEKGQLKFRDQGLLVSVGEQTIYLRTTSTGAPMGAGAGLALMAGVVVSRTLKLGTGPNPASLPIRRAAQAILGAPLSDEEKVKRLATLAAALGGSRVEVQGEQLRAAPLGGYEVQIVPR